MSKHLSDRDYMGTRIMEAAAKRAGNNTPCFGRHCSGAHPLPVKMFHEPELYDVSSAYPRVDEFPTHVTYSFHRGIPIPHETPVNLAKLILSTESPFQSREKMLASGTYGKVPNAV